MQRNIEILFLQLIYSEAYYPGKDNDPVRYAYTCKLKNDYLSVIILLNWIAGNSILIYGIYRKVTLNLQMA